MVAEIEDGLPTPEVGRWAETKYRLIRLYDSLFATGMKDKWDERIYIDLYAGAGQSRIRGTSLVVLGSPLLALSVKHPFDKYIFCEEDPNLINALKARVTRLWPDADVTYITGDCNERINEISRKIPTASANHTVLGLCLVDPFDLGIKFKSIRHLSKWYLDFLCLLALHMDANRNYSRYVSEESQKVDEFLGSTICRKNGKNSNCLVFSFQNFCHRI
jgi:three-Cys-motif partner protein